MKSLKIKGKDNNDACMFSLVTGNGPCHKEVQPKAKIASLYPVFVIKATEKQVAMTAIRLVNVMLKCGFTILVLGEIYAKVSIHI